MRYTQGFSVVSLIILIVVTVFGTWGISKFVYERGLEGPPKKTQSYGSWWSKVRTITWTSYQDKEFRFALRYPSSWVLKKSEAESGFPLWDLDRQPKTNARVRIRQGDLRCMPGSAFTVVSFGEILFPVCELEEGDDLWYVTEFLRGKEVYMLSCRYGIAIKNCYDFFFSFNFIK